METLRSWALTVALAALAGGLVWMLTPKGNVQKAVRTVVAVFLLCAFLSPLFARRGEGIDWIFPEAAEPPTLPGFSAEVSRQLRQAVEDELTRRMEETLARRNLSGQIILRTDILDDGGINIAAAKVELPPGAAAAGLAQALREATGIEVQVTVGNE